MICYAYLEDVPPLVVNPDTLVPDYSRFKKARWFTRGWCLQELIAPRQIEFYANDWSKIGTKDSLYGLIHDITQIPQGALLREVPLDEFSTAERMSWAARRQTTRPEDMAYSLLGIFGVNMPMLYGEGRHRAFYRLQEEILKKSEDLSLLLWTDPSLPTTWLTDAIEDFDIRSPVLAHGPQCFSEFTGLVLSFSQAKGPFADEDNMMTIGATISWNYSDIHHVSSIAGGMLTLPEPLKSGKAHYFPPQNTSRGLRVRLPAWWRSRYFNGKKHKELVMWTGCRYMSNRSAPCYMVCIRLVPETHSGNNWGKRRFERLVNFTAPILLYPKDYEEWPNDISYQELYLRTQWQDTDLFWPKNPTGNLLGPPSDKVKLVLVFSPVGDSDAMFDIVSSLPFVKLAPQKLPTSKGYITKFVISLPSQHVLDKAFVQVNIKTTAKELAGHAPKWLCTTLSMSFFDRSYDLGCTIQEGVFSQNDSGNSQPPAEFNIFSSPLGYFSGPCNAMIWSRNLGRTILAKFKCMDYDNQRKHVLQLDVSQPKTPIRST